MKRRLMARVLAGGMLLGVGGVAGAEAMAVLAEVQPGEWQIHEVGDKAPPRTMCVSDVHTLLQIEHAAATCTFRTVSAEADKATVRYVCPGAGNGMTELSRESRSLLRLHTQGVQRGAPFDITYEARFAGPCGGGLTRR